MTIVLELLAAVLFLSIPFYIAAMCLWRRTFRSVFDDAYALGRKHGFENRRLNDELREAVDAGFREALQNPRRKTNAQA